MIFTSWNILIWLKICLNLPRQKTRPYNIQEKRRILKIVDFAVPVPTE